MNIKSIIESDNKFNCNQLMRTVDAKFCFGKCGECGVPRAMRLALIRSHLEYETYFKKDNGIINFRVHDLLGSVCVRKLILKVLKPLKSFPSIDGLNQIERGKVAHDLFRKGYEIHTIHLMYEEEYEGIKFAIHGEVDYYDTFYKSIDDLKTTEWMPSYSNNHGKEKDIEQIRLYDGLNTKGRVVKYFDENDILHTDLDFGDFKLDVEKLRLLYYNMGGSTSKNLKDYNESYEIKRDLQLFDSKLNIVREAIRFIADYKKTGVAKLPILGRRRCAGCDYKGVIC